MAKRKRQNEKNGSNFYKEVKRPRVIQNYYEACGQIDLHNNFRQGQLRLEKFFKTKHWNRRVLTSILSSTMVDAFRAWEFHFPPGIRDADNDMKSRLKSFVARVIDETKPELSTDELPPNVLADHVCQLELIGN